MNFDPGIKFIVYETVNFPQTVLKVLNVHVGKALGNWKIYVKAYQNDYGNFDDYNKTIKRNYNH